MPARFINQILFQLKKNKFTIILVLPALYPGIFFLQHFFSWPFIVGTILFLLFFYGWAHAPKVNRFLKWSYRTASGVFWIYLAVITILLIRSFVLASGGMGLAAVGIVLLLRLSKKISYKHYLLLMMDTAQLITAALLIYPYLDVMYLPREKPAYRSDIISYRGPAMACDNLPQKFQDYFFDARRIHFYEHDLFLVAANTYKRTGVYLNAVAARRENDRWQIQCLMGNFYTDIIWDEVLSKYYVLSMSTDELLIFNADLKLSNRLKTAHFPVHIFMDVKPSGQRRLIITTEMGLNLQYVDPETLITLAVYHPFFSGQYHSTIDPGRRRMLASTIFPYIAASISLDDPSQFKIGVPGTYSWGNDLDPAGNHLYITDFFLGRLTKADADTMKVEKSRLLQPGLRPVVYDPKRKLIYVGSYHSKDILVLDEELETLGRFLSAGTTRDMYLSQDRQTLFLGGMGGIYAVNIDLALKSILPPGGKRYPSWKDAS